MRRILLIGAIPMVLIGCTNTSDLKPEDFLAERQPVNPAEEISGNTYRTVLGGYHPRTVVEPKPWGNKSPKEEKSQ